MENGLGSGIGLFLDGVVLVFLGITIFYVARLSIYLKTFKNSRKEMDALIHRLSKDIVHAEGLVQGMRLSAQETCNELQELVGESKFLSDELRFMNETGNNLADKLEKLAERNSVAASQPSYELEPEQSFGDDEDLFEEYEEEDRAPTFLREDRYMREDEYEAAPKEEESPFMIRDPEFEDEEDFGRAGAGGGNVETMKPRSQAEQELREALERLGVNARRKAGGRG